MIPTPRRSAVTLGVLALILGWVSQAGAQESTIPSSMFEGHQDKRVIASQLRWAAKLGRKALVGFEAAPRDPSLALDEAVNADAIRAARETYGLIRGARHGLELMIGNQKFPDPIDQLIFKQLTDAWNLSRYPGDKWTWAVPREEYLSTSVESLSRAVQIVDRVLVLLP